MMKKKLRLIHNFFLGYFFLISVSTFINCEQTIGTHIELIAHNDQTGEIEKPIRAVVSPNGQWILTIYEGDGGPIAHGTARLWDADGNFVSSFPHDEVFSYSNAISMAHFPSGNRLITTVSLHPEDIEKPNTQVHIWDLTSLKETVPPWSLRLFYNAYGSGMGPLVFSPNEHFLVLSDRSRALTIWDADHTTLLKEFDEGTISPDGILVVGRTKAGEIEIWDLSTLTPTKQATLQGQFLWGNTISFSPNKTKLILEEGRSGDPSPIIHIFDLHDGKEITQISTGFYSSFSPDDSKVLTFQNYSETENSLYQMWHAKKYWLWDAQTGKQLAHLEGYIVGDFHPNSESLFLWKADEFQGHRYRDNMYLYNPVTQQSSVIALGFGKPVLSPDQSKLVLFEFPQVQFISSGKNKGELAGLWSIPSDGTGSQHLVAHLTIRPEDYDITKVWNPPQAWNPGVFFPDGNRVLLFGTDGIPRIWNL